MFLLGSFVAILVLYVLLLRPWMLRWGASPEEVRKPLPGDKLAPNSNQSSTRAITIHAPPQAVWGWVAQIGQERGGFYSYQSLENLVGCQITNAERVTPEWELQVGDSVRLGAQEALPGYRVVQAAAPHVLVLQGVNPQTNDLDPVTWQYILEALPDNHTRLIVRSRMRFEPSVPNFILWRVITEPLHFIMEQKMLRGIKARAERAATSTATAAN